MRKKIIVLSSIALLILSFGCKKVKVVDVFVEEFEVLPKYRCPSDDILIKWKLSKEKDGSSTYCYDYGITIYAQDKNDQDRKVELYQSDENEGEILINLNETFVNDIPKEVIVIGEPKESPGTQCLTDEKKINGSKSTDVVTIYDKLEVLKSGFNDENNLNRFIVNFDPILWSNNLYVESFKITKGCNNTLSGAFEFDKGIATGNIDKRLNGENNYKSEFVNSPVNLIGDWLVIANSETGCGLKPETIEIAVTLVCLTP